jgi:hypothetical protein
MTAIHVCSSSNTSQRTRAAEVATNRPHPTCHLFESRLAWHTCSQTVELLVLDPNRTFRWHQQIFRRAPLKGSVTEAIRTVDHRLVRHRCLLPGSLFHVFLKLANGDGECLMSWCE